MEINLKQFGIEPGTLTIVGSRPGVGKTTFALRLVEKAVIDGNLTNFYSLDENTGRIYIEDIVTKIRDNGNIKVVVIDYLDLVSSNVDHKNRAQEVSYIVSKLKKIAKELNISVVAMCQLNRALDDSNPNREPKLSDLRELSDIEKYADNVLFLHREKHEDENKIIVAKKRYGSVG